MIPRNCQISDTCCKPAFKIGKYGKWACRVHENEKMGKSGRNKPKVVSNFISISIEEYEDLKLHKKLYEELLNQ